MNFSSQPVSAQNMASHGAAYPMSRNAGARTVVNPGDMPHSSTPRTVGVHPSRSRPHRVNAVGRPRTVSDAYLQRLKELVSHDPRSFGYPFRRWTARWLNQHLVNETGVSVSDRHINRLLKQMGLSTRTSYANSALSRRQNPNLHIQIADLSAEAQAVLQQPPLTPTPLTPTPLTSTHPTPMPPALSSREMGQEANAGLGHRSLGCD